MVATTKQLIANRENAKKGGVKTEQGKAISRFNAVKHGIFTDTMVDHIEKIEALNQLRQKIFDELKPKGIIEQILVDRIVVCIWRLRRCAVADKAIIKQDNVEVEVNSNGYMDVLQKNARAFNSTEWIMNNGRFELLLRYETTIERQMYRVMRELRELQRIRFDSEQKFLPQP